MVGLTTTSVLIFTGCQKDLIIAPELVATTTFEKSKITLPAATNPFSLRNVQKAKAAIAANSSPIKGNTPINLTGNEPQFVYFKFNPNQLSGDQFDAIKNDSTVFMLQIPFANMVLYTEEFGFDSTKAEQLKDGNIYGVTPISNTNVISKLTSRAETQTVLLDTLVQVAEEDTATQFQAFREIGYTEEQIDQLRICLFKRPHGYVRYLDNDLGQGHLEPVRGMAVWGLVFGIPALSFTNDNGYYQLPWRFSFGTIMGTFAKNDKVVVRPINTTVELNVLINEFIVGAMTIENWYSSCQMRYEINFHYTRHSKTRYWSQILNGYYFHHQYTGTDNISASPKGMVCYAQWAPGSGFGYQSAPMLNFIGANPNLIEEYLHKWWGGTFLSTYFALLISHQLPDNTYKVGASSEPYYYTSRFAQTIFHELGHASHYKQVGNNWYAKLVSAESKISGAGYGDGNYDDGGKVQVAESWAEFIGTQHARRRYGDNGFKDYTEFGIADLTLANIDREKKFVEQWIPTGFYYDLIDNINAYTFENSDDAIGGSSIQNMYYVFNSGTTDMCHYISQFINAYPVFNTAQMVNLAGYHDLGCF